MNDLSSQGRGGSGLPVAADTFSVVLISPYEIGRQPFGLAQPAAWLSEAGCAVTCIDLSVQKLEPDALSGAGLIGVYVAMHTAARIAMEALPKIREAAPDAHICVYGLYAPVNEALFRELGAGTVLGGEFEPDMKLLSDYLRGHAGGVEPKAVVNLASIDYKLPKRDGLPGLSSYARLIMPDGEEKTCGFTETTRGCKHMCRHCPVVPVYHGKFRVVPVAIVIEDIRQQIGRGAQHISFGDPDFLNGPGHARRVIEALHAEFPDITYDATIKIEHILQYPEMLAELRDTGCILMTSAVESVDDQVLEYLDKGHTNADFSRAVELLRANRIAFAPTFVAFTPWTTLTGYLALLQRLVELRLVESVPPIQLAIRLLVPQGSYLLKLDGFADLLQPFDRYMLGYPWEHVDPRVDALQSRIESLVAKSDEAGMSRREVFMQIWQMTHAACHQKAPAIDAQAGGDAVPHLSEQWYCCAEPTNQQLKAF